MWVSNSIFKSVGSKLKSSSFECKRSDKMLKYFKFQNFYVISYYWLFPKASAQNMLHQISTLELTSFGLLKQNDWSIGIKTFNGIVRKTQCFCNHSDLFELDFSQGVVKFLYEL